MPAPRRVRRSLAIGVLSVTAVLTSGCGEATEPVGSPSPSESVAEAPTGLDAQGVSAWNLWQAQDLDSYRYRLTVGCFCPALMGVEVEVRDGEVVRFDGKPYDDEVIVPGFDGMPPTLDEMFAVLGDDLQNADEVTVQYDPETGVPVSIEVDHMANAIDDEMSYRVERLQPLEPQA